MPKTVRRLLPWWHPKYEPDTINFDALSLPDKQKSKRVKWGGVGSYQADRKGCTVTVKFFWLNRLQRNATLTFCAREWPVHPFDQVKFAERLQADMAKRVFNEEWDIHMTRQADAIAKAVRQVLEPQGPTP